jgi:predicted regulator of Ras-like GTPase activity (Roadblock/LC7/MglB family)
MFAPALGFGAETPEKISRGGIMAKGEALKGHIEALRNSIPELKGVLLASNEGLPIAHSLSNGADPNRVAAMAAAASSLGRRISESMNSGTLGEVSIQADEGALFVYSAGSKAVLAVISPQGGNAGLIHIEARSAAKDIGDLF